MSNRDGKVDVAKPGFLRRFLPIIGWLASCNRRLPAGAAAAGLSVSAPPALASAESIRHRPKFVATVLRSVSMLRRE